MRHWLGGTVFAVGVKTVGALVLGCCKRNSSVSLVLGDCVFYGVAWHFCRLILLQAKVETDASKAKGDQASSGNSQFRFKRAPFVLGLDSISLFGEWGRSLVGFAVNDSLCCGHSRCLKVINQIIVKYHT